MNGPQIPDDDHVVHLCSGGSIDPAGRVTSTAFFLKDKAEYVSVNWLEFLRLPTRIEEIAEVRRILMEKVTLRRTGRLAVLNVGRTKQKIRTESKQEIQVTHYPEPNDPSHSGLVYPAGNATVVEYLAQFVADSVVETHPAVTI